MENRGYRGSDSYFGGCVREELVLGQGAFISCCCGKFCDAKPVHGSFLTERKRKPLCLRWGGEEVCGMDESQDKGFFVDPVTLSEFYRVLAVI